MKKKHPNSSHELTRHAVVVGFTEQTSPSVFISSWLSTPPLADCTTRTLGGREMALVVALLATRRRRDGVESAAGVLGVRS